MEELKKELEEEVDDESGGDVALYDCSSLEERFEDVVVCLYDLIDSMDKNKFRCSEYRNIEEKDGRIIDEDGEGVYIYCADERRNRS